MFSQTTHCVQIRDRGFGGDDMGLLDLMPANIVISFAINQVHDGRGVECALGLMQRLWPSGIEAFILV